MNPQGTFHIQVESTAHEQWADTIQSPPTHRFFPSRKNLGLAKVVSPVKFCTTWPVHQVTWHRDQVTRPVILKRQSDQESFNHFHLTREPAVSSARPSACGVLFLPHGDCHFKRCYQSVAHLWSLKNIKNLWQYSREPFLWSLVCLQRRGCSRI